MRPPVWVCGTGSNDALDDEHKFEFDDEFEFDDGSGDMASAAVTATGRELLNERYLLDDAAVARFVVEGYTLVETDFPPEFHRAVCRRIEEVLRGGNPGNEILARVPELQAVYDHPAVRGALVSLLGPEMAMHAHRHCHALPPGHGGQQWHQDDVNRRHHRIWRVLAMYYPQDVTAEMGPTMILPGTQYRNAPTARMASYGVFDSQVALSVKAGTVAITHYDLWHRATPNRSDRTRYMLKFLFDRTRKPEGPSWRADPERKEQTLTDFIRVWPPLDNQTDCYKHRLIWMDVWKWLYGEEGREDTIIDRYP